MRYMVIGKRQLLSAGSVLLILLFAAACAMGVLAQKPKSSPIVSVEREDKRIGLTFTVQGDADPEQILDVLQRYNAKATFFLTADWVSAYPDRAKELAAAGMELGCLIENTADGQAARDSLQFCRQRIQAAAGVVPGVFRTADDRWDAAMLGLDCPCVPVSFSLDSRDAAGDGGVQQIADRILSGAAGGAIVRLTVGAKYTPAALPYILESLIAKGYEPATLSRLLWPAPYTVDGEGVQRKAE